MQKAIKTIKNYKFTYSHKLWFWGICFFLLTFFSTIFNTFFTGSSTSNIPLSILVFFGIYLLFYVLIYFFESRTWKDLTLVQMITYVFFSLIFSIFIYLMYLISWLTYGYNATLPFWALVIIQLIFTLVLMFGWIWTVQMVMLTILFKSPNARSTEFSIRMFFRKLTKRWTIFSYSDYAILISRHSIFIVKFFFEEDKVKSITFNHGKNSFDDKGNPLIEEIDDDLIVKNIKSIASEITKKLKINVIPAFVFDYNTPINNHKPKNFIICNLSDLAEEVKPFDSISELKISQHHRIIEELSK